MFLTSFYFDWLRPWECGIVGVYLVIDIGVTTTIRVEFRGIQPLTTPFSDVIWNILFEIQEVIKKQKN